MPKPDARTSGPQPTPTPPQRHPHRLGPTWQGWLVRALGRMGLFWRTFLYLGLLLVGCLAAWMQTLVALEFEPQALQSARQVASLVNLTRAALEHADPIARVSLVKTLVDEERLRIAPREPGDSYLGYETDSLSRHIAEELRLRLGPGTVVAREVNGFDGLWVGFTMDKDTYWLLLDPHRVATVQGRTWLVWMGIALLLSLAGSALIADWINRPLKRLLHATQAVRAQRFADGLLSEQAPTREVREVNMGFNRMARALQQAQAERELMLAGISHDLRTPLTRLRLEAELSVPDAQARNAMVADIEQADGIIDKFMDYARPSQTMPQVVDLAELAHTALAHLAGQPDLRLSATAMASTEVLADPVDLQRVLTNLLENARRYGKTPGQAHAEVTLSLQQHGNWVALCVCDHGMGVPAATLHQLTQPFFRGDAARSQALGAGLGLSVVDKLLQRMGGRLQLHSPAPGNHDSVGFSAELWLPKAGSDPALTKPLALTDMFSDRNPPPPAG